ncbi:hypothetical protein [Bartonella mastomydis]|uniref:hypothetical protein n=1 Tax=Bartonella mastomydis TaxID=1820002 RepID=UPI001117117C|nr:hypothetical protein [Bartonella mastomydis]
MALFMVLQRTEKQEYIKVFFVLKLFSAKLIRKLMREPHEKIHGKTDEKHTKTMRKPQNEQEILNLKTTKEFTLLRQQRKAP